MRTVVGLLVALLVAACGEPAPSPAAGDPQGDWRLVGGTVNGQEVPIPDEQPITLTIDASSVRARVCNSFGGTLTVTDGRVRIPLLEGTAMACVDDDVMTAENLVMTALTSADSFTVEDGVLFVRGAGVELRYVEAVAEPSG